MKELDLHERQSKDKSIEILQKKKQKREYKLVNSIIPMKGHSIWEIYVTTLSVNKAEELIHKEVSWWDAIKMVQNPSYKKQVQIKPNCVYISALNQESAIQRYLKDKGSCVKAANRKSINLW